MDWKKVAINAGAAGGGAFLTTYAVTRDVVASLVAALAAIFSNQAGLGQQPPKAPAQAPPTK